MIAQPERAFAGGRTARDRDAQDASNARPLQTEKTALERFDDDAEAGAILYVSVEPETAWRLKGRAAPREPRRWGHLAGAIGDGEFFVFAIANLFDADAFRRREGYGWIGFDIDLSPHWASVSGHTVRFVCMKSGAPVFEYDAPVLDAFPPAKSRRRMEARAFALDARARREAIDPQQLRLYVEAFAVRNGLEEFVRRAHRYALQRDADGPELASHCERLAAGTPVATVFASVARIQRATRNGSVASQSARRLRFPVLSGLSRDAL